MSKIIMPYIDYKKYPYAFQPSKTEIVDVIQKKENSNDVWLNVEYIKINDGLYKKLTPMYYPSIATLISHPNDIKVDNFKETNLFKIPYGLLDHEVICNITNYENSSIPIIFSFPYQSFIGIKDAQENMNDLWRMYWVNPKFLQYNNNCPSLCFIFNSYEADTILYTINEEFIGKYGEPVFYKDDILTISERKELEEEYDKYITENH